MMSASPSTLLRKQVHSLLLASGNELRQPSSWSPWLAIGHYRKTPVANRLDTYRQAGELRHRRTSRALCSKLRLYDLQNRTVLRGHPNQDHYQTRSVENLTIVLARRI